MFQTWMWNHITMHPERSYLLLKIATTGKEFNAHAKLYHCLLKMLVDAYDSVVTRVSFSKLIYMVASIPRMYVDDDAPGKNWVAEGAGQTGDVQLHQTNW
jgi:hypothetical protein